MVQLFCRILLFVCLFLLRQLFHSEVILIILFATIYNNNLDGSRIYPKNKKNKKNKPQGW